MKRFFSFALVLPLEVWQSCVSRCILNGVFLKIMRPVCVMSSKSATSRLASCRLSLMFVVVLPLLSPLFYCCRLPSASLRSVFLQAEFHGWLTGLMESGNITRQEAVSMLPPLFLDVQPKHMVRRQTSKFKLGVYEVNYIIL